MPTLTPEQKKSKSLALDWFFSNDNHKPFILTGYAGTGKTTVLASFAAELEALGVTGVQLCAPTGKAASVLASKLNAANARGISASTVHRCFYENPEEIDGKLRFSKKAKVGVRLAVIDEASMVTEAMLTDILTFGVPVMLVGDPFQLPPISGVSALSKRTPDVNLTAVMRQALDSPITRLATDVRNGVQLPDRLFSSNERGTVGIDYGKPGKMWADRFYAAVNGLDTVVLCYKNATRHKLNMTLRERLGYDAEYDTPEVGDKLVILTNNNEAAVYNGETHILTKIKPTGNLDYDFVELAGIETEIPMYNGCFYNSDVQISVKKMAEEMRGPIPPVAADFGYALSVHKAQGSEWRNAVIIDEYPEYKEVDYARWMYTAITRASRNLVITKL